METTKAFGLFNFADDHLTQKTRVQWLALLYRDALYKRVQNRDRLFEIFDFSIRVFVMLDPQVVDRFRREAGMRLFQGLTEYFLLLVKRELEKR